MDGESLRERVWIVIPAFREARVIREVVEGVRRHFPHVVVVDDGSGDETAAEAAAGGAAVVRHPVNLGQGAALQTGVTFALAQGATYIATFDADGQHRIEDVVAMAETIEGREVDIVLGSRFIGRAVGMSAGRRLLLRAAVLFTRLTTGLTLSDAHNGLRVMNRTAARAIRLRQNRMAHASEILEQIAEHRLRYAEVGNTVVYTEYSMAKGQRASNAVNIVVDLMLGRFHK